MNLPSQVVAFLAFSQGDLTLFHSAKPSLMPAWKANARVM